MANDKLTLYVPADLKREAKIKAAQQETSISAKVREWLQQWVAEDIPAQERPKGP